MSRLLLVDDEINVLNALRRELAGEHDIETFTSPVEALQRSKEIAFDLVIADYKMPEMNGVEFLKQFGSLQPDAARMLLSGETDIDALLRLINETHIYLFLAKPWDRMELQASLTQALAYRDIVLENRQLAHPGTAPQQQGNACRIVLVDGDEYALGVMARGLADAGGSAFLYEAIRQELPGTLAHLHDSQFVVDCFTTAVAALAHAQRSDCDLVIAAQTLPDMDGIQLLGKLRAIRPETALILVSASPDKALLSRAINEVHVHSVLCLHWSTHELKSDARRQMWNIYKLRTAAIQALTSRALLLESRRLQTAPEAQRRPR